MNIVLRIYKLFVKTRGSKSRNSVQRIALLVFFVAVSALPQLTLAADLKIELTLDKSEYRGNEPVNIKYALTNTGTVSMTVLKWNTPLEGMVGNPFIVTLEGAAEERAYSGVHIGRIGGPVDEDWVSIGAGESISATVDLSAAYDLSEVGRYEVRMRRGLHHAMPSSQARPKRDEDLERVDVPSNTVRFRKTEPGVPREQKGAQTPRAATTAAAAPIIPVSCTSTHLNSLRRAFSDMAEVAATIAPLTNNLTCQIWDDKTSENKKYGEPARDFFGAPPNNACTASRLEKVQSVVSQVNAYANGSDPITIDCSGVNSCGAESHCPRPNVYAFTCGPSEIYVCPHFFTFPVSTTGGNSLDSQESFLYHEIAHWDQTIDYKYGQGNCCDLAKNNPDEAINNADNYRFYAIAEEALAIGTDDYNLCGIEHFAFGVPLLGFVFFGGRVALRSRYLS